MLQTIFYIVLNMSIASCFVIGILLLIRLIKPLKRSIVYPLWGIAFLRLVLPFTFAADWSLFNIMGNLVKRLVTAETVTGTEIPIIKNSMMMNMAGAATSYAPIDYKTESLRTAFTVGALVWITLAAAALIAAAALYMLTRSELSKAKHYRDNLFVSDMVLSPVLVNVIRPRIIIPPGFDAESAEGQMVLAHEEVHRRRLDNLWRAAAIVIACVHWFNPLVWVMLRAFFTDMEKSCDEAVIRRYSQAERNTYAAALLRFAEDKRMIVSAAFGRSGVKTRIMNVLEYKRLTVIGAVASLLFAAAIAVILLTNPQLRG